MSQSHFHFTASLFKLPVDNQTADTAANNLRGAPPENKGSYTFSSSANNQKYMKKLFEIHHSLHESISRFREKTSQPADGKSAETHFWFIDKIDFQGMSKPVIESLDRIKALLTDIKNSNVSHQKVLSAAPNYLAAALTILKQPSKNSQQAFDKKSKKFPCSANKTRT